MAAAMVSCRVLRPVDLDGQIRWPGEVVGLPELAARSLRGTGHVAPLAPLPPGDPARPWLEACARSLN